MIQLHSAGSFPQSGTNIECQLVYYCCSNIRMMCLDFSPSVCAWQWGRKQNIKQTPLSHRGMRHACVGFRRAAWLGLAGLLINKTSPVSEKCARNQLGQSGRDAGLIPQNPQHPSPLPPSSTVRQSPQPALWSVSNVCASLLVNYSACRLSYCALLKRSPHHAYCHWPLTVVGPVCAHSHRSQPAAEHVGLL